MNNFVLVNRDWIRVKAHDTGWVEDDRLRFSTFNNRDGRKWWKRGKEK